MNLGIMGPGPNPLVQRYPCVCPHCGVTRWYQPAEPMDLWPAECLAAIRAVRDEDGNIVNEGSQFWHAILEEGRRQGREERDG